MTIWLAYANFPITTAVYIERALRQSHVVRTVGPRLPEEAIEAWGLQNMHLPLTALDIDTSFTPDMAALLADTPIAEHPDLYLWVESVYGYWPRNIKYLKCPTACYLIDTHYHLTSALETARHFDFVFIAQLIDLEAFRAVHPHVYWLPLACDPEIHGHQDVAKFCDIGFVGSMNPCREQMLDYLARHVNVHRERSFWLDMARTFSGSRIVLNNASMDDLNMRFFEALASGSLLLSNPTNGSAQDILFRDGVEYACYNDENLLEVVQRYLSDDALREQVAALGRQRVLAAHTYRHRTDDMLDVLLHGKPDTFSPEELRERSEAIVLLPDLQTQSNKIALDSAPHIRAIITTRFCNRWPTWQMVHEWEDIIAARLGVPLKPSGESCMVSDPDYGEQSYDLMFLQLASELRYYEYNPKIIPIVMDLWRDDFNDFRQRAGSFRLVFVSNLQAFQELVPELPNLRYLPFSLADQYLDWRLPPKDIDVIQYGRRNPLLDSYMSSFLERYPATRYVTTEASDDGLKVLIQSNQDGLIAESDTRATFMNILGRCKVSLVSTVTMDGSRDTGGIDPVSPRFYESMAAGCYLVGRIPDNDEFRESGINQFCRHVGNYNDFEVTLLHLLAADGAPQKGCQPFLQQHLTSALAPMILAELHSLRSAEKLCDKGITMQATRLQADLTLRLSLINELKAGLTPPVTFANYRTLSHVIGFYAEFWGLDLFNNFFDILAAQDSIICTLQLQAFELLYRNEPHAASIVARRAMELAAPDNVQQTLLYADMLRRSGEIDAARKVCCEIQGSSDDVQAVLDMCVIDEQLPLKMEHYHLLHKAHAALRPRRYIEIGICSGRSLALIGAGTSAIGVDPMTAVPEQQFFHSPEAAPRLFQMKSNDFFQQGLMEKEWGKEPFDMAFIDGLHVFEQALMDFVNLERRSGPDSVIFLHDCLPVSIIGAERERCSMVWTGDVWKVISCLKAVRPDLEIITVPVRPSGLAIIRNLDRNSKVLASQFDAVVGHFMMATLPEDMTERFRMLNVTSMEPQAVIDNILALQGPWQREQ